MSLTEEILFSWSTEEGKKCSTDELLRWIQDLNSSTYVNIRKCSIYDSDFWFYDDYNGEVLNRKRSFFSIRGMRYFEDGEFLKEQPIIDQPEIGYLGILCKRFDGVLHFLMQAKIEPGNVNCVQISPTVQATKSNFTRAHGGNLPLYFEYFEHTDRYQILYDQIQSEQAARFYRKRNRNMVMLVEDDVEEHPNFRWMTLGQIKKLMEIDNLVNMDTRTVLSGLPFLAENLSDEEKAEMKRYFKDEPLYRSLFQTNLTDTLPTVFRKLNDYKMFHEITVAPVPLNQLVDWHIDEYGITCKGKADYSVGYYDIEIAGREVRRWIQPLFCASGQATFGLLTKVVNDVRKFLIRIKPEIGSFDKVELGPTVQWEPTHGINVNDPIETLFDRYIKNGASKDVRALSDVILSEEGGRFYHEQNRNLILEADSEIPLWTDKDSMWVDFSTLNYLVQSNGFLNIQLRNLISLIKR